MNNVQQIDFDGLSQLMQTKLVRISRLRIIVRCLTCVVYSMTLCWFGYCLYNAFFGCRTEYNQGNYTWLYFIGGAVVFYALFYVMSVSLTTLNDKEIKVMREIMNKMYPEARYSANKSVPRQILADSRLFDVLGSCDPYISHTGYGCVEFRERNRSTSVFDMGVTSDKASKIMYQVPGLGFLAIIYRYIMRPIFGTRIESTMHSFRGMFGYNDSSLYSKGAVIILPDNLEEKIGYLAHGIQSFRRKNEASLVVLEDPEFENLFAVYADDEVEARKILTPAMMHRITNLRRTFGRELMLSFNGDKVYYASATSDGFLRPGRKSLNDARLLEQIYHEINFCRTLSDELS